MKKLPSEKRNQNSPVMIAVIATVLFLVFCIGSTSTLSAMYPDASQKAVTGIVLLFIILVLDGWMAGSSRK